MGRSRIYTSNAERQSAYRARRAARRAACRPDAVLLALHLALSEAASEGNVQARLLIGATPIETALALAGEYRDWASFNASTRASQTICRL